MLSVTADTCNHLKTIWQKDLGININNLLDILFNLFCFFEARAKFIVQNSRMLLLDTIKALQKLQDSWKQFMLEGE